MVTGEVILDFVIWWYSVYMYVELTAGWLWRYMYD